MEATKQVAPIKFVHPCVGIIQGKFMAEGYTFLSACLQVPYLQSAMLNPSIPSQT